METRSKTLQPMMWLGIVILSALMVALYWGLNLPNAEKTATGDPG